MKRITLFLILIPVVVFLLSPGCGGKYENKEALAEFSFADEASIAESQIGVAAVSPDMAPAEGETFEKKIIRNGHLSIESKNLELSRHMLDSLVLHFEGYVSSETFNDQGNQISFNLSCRIPAEKFDAFISGIEAGPDRILSKSVNTDDVTEQYYDIRIRLENDRQVEKRYIELLGRASTVRDILDIEENLGRIRQEIESKEGRLRYLDDRINYSTLNLWVYQTKKTPYEPEDREPFGTRLIRSFHKGWQGFVDVILFLLKLWPLWLAGILAWRSILWIRARRKRQNPVR